jgi:hypothetical protein
MSHSAASERQCTMDGLGLGVKEDPQLVLWVCSASIVRSLQVVFHSANLGCVSTRRSMGSVSRNSFGLAEAGYLVLEQSLAFWSGARGERQCSAVTESLRIAIDPRCIVPECCR